MNEQQLNEISAYAGLGFPPIHIACIMQLNIEHFVVECKDPFSEIGSAYLAGKLKVEAEVRKAVFTLSKQGSGPAQILAIKILKKQEIDELKS